MGYDRGFMLFILFFTLIFRSRANIIFTKLPFQTSNSGLMSARILLNLTNKMLRLLFNIYINLKILDHGQIFSYKILTLSFHWFHTFNNLNF